MQTGNIKENYSPYSSPVTLVHKYEEKKICLRVDFQKLTAIAIADTEPLPKNDSFLEKLAQAKDFSSLDLTSGYWLIHTKILKN